MDKLFYFHSLPNVVDFIKPLILEGFEVSMKPVYKKDCGYDKLDKFAVLVGEKQKEEE